MSGPANPARKGRWRWYLAGLLVGAVVAVPAAVCVYAHFAAEWELREAIAEADRLDRGWRLEELEAKRDVLAPEKNAALVVLEVKKLLPPDEDWQRHEARFERLPPEVRLSEEQAGALEAWLHKRSAAVTLALKLADRPGGRYPIEYRPNPIDTLLPCDGARSVAALLRDEVRLRAQRQDAAGALRGCRALLNTSRSIGDEPMAVSQLVRIAVRAITLAEVERVLAQTEPPEADLADLQQRLEADEAVSLLLIVARAERASADRTVQFLFQEMAKADSNWREWLWAWSPGALARERAACLRCLTQFVETARLPVEQQRPVGRAQDEQLRALDEQVRTAARQPPLMMLLLAPSMMRLGEACWRSHAQMRCGVAAVAAERYRLAKGTWPESLAALADAGYLRAVPLDPFDGKPLRLRRLDDGVVIHSIGPDGDDGGRFNRERLGEKGSDLGIRLWDVPRRRQPPSPALQ